MVYTLKKRLFLVCDSLKKKGKVNFKIFSGYGGYITYFLFLNLDFDLDRKTVHTFENLHFLARKKD